MQKLDRTRQEPEWLRVRDVCALLQIAADSIPAFVAAGTLPPPAQLGPKCRRWHRDTLLRHVGALAGADILLDGAGPKSGK